jgi:hypothetical protein
MRKLKYIIQDFRWIKALFSPFTPFTVKWYVGKTTVGTPYFLPRKLVKATPALATKAALQDIKRATDWNKANPTSTFQHTVKSFDEAYAEQMKNRHYVPLKVGFSYNGLGWKTKWTSTDFRHEWNPTFSFVFFGYQIAAIVCHKYNSHYWESWLCYEYASDKKRSIKSRLAFCRRKCPQTWRQLGKDGKDDIVTNYWDLILKPKYLKKKQHDHK